MKTTQLFSLFIAFISLFYSNYASGQTFTVNVLQGMCNDDGSAEVVLDGIPEPVTVEWYHTSLEETFSGLNPTNLKDGSYTVTVTDVNDVQYTQYAWIESVIFWFPNNWPAAEAPCPGGTATTDISIYGGTPSYEVYIDDVLDGTTASDTYTTSPLGIGTYDVMIIDADGCRSGYFGQETDSSQITVQGVTDLLYEFEYTETTCGVYDVAANLVTESNPPYVNYWSYWQDGAWVEEYTDVLSGVSGPISLNYHTTDAEGCVMVFNEYFNPPNVVQAWGIAAPANCPNDDGLIDMTVFGGTAPYTFEWNTGATTEDISNLAYGNYTLTATDSEGCTNQFTKHVGLNSTMNVYGAVTPPNCPENIAGSINSSIFGGTAPYTYSWSNGETTEDITADSFGYYSLTVTDAQGCVEGQGFFIPVSDPCYSYVSGTSYYDLDGNCDINGDDFPMNSNIYSTNGNYLYYHGFNGNYSRRFLEDVEITASSDGYDLICPAADVALSHVPNEQYSDVDFYLQPQTLEDDLCVYVNSNHPVPGFYGDTYIYVSNPGTTIQNATVTLEYTTLIDFINSNPAPSAIDEDNGTVTWDLGTVYPNSTKTINMDFYTDPSVDLGEIVEFTTTLSDLPTDVNLENNSSTVEREVIGSYDPNDKQATPSGVGETNMIDPLTDELFYRVRFQNTGTAPAVNVVIEDEIDITKLDIQTLQVLTTSHTMTNMMYDGNKVLFAFENIYLPDSTANLEASQGYIDFKIKVLEGHPLGTVIENTAAIFFDFNEPIITNTSFVTLDEESVVIEQLNASFNLFPNPSVGELTVSLDQEIEAIEVLDITGRVVMQQVLNTKNSTVQLPQNIENGTYLLRFFSGDYIGSKEFILNR